MTGVRAPDRDKRIKRGDADDRERVSKKRHLFFLWACLLIPAYSANGQEKNAVGLLEKWVEVGILNPLALFSMVIAFAFSLLSNMLIFFLLFIKHKSLSIILFTVSFLAAVALSFVPLHFFYSLFVERVSGVDLGGSPLGLIFTLVPPIGGFALSRHLFIHRNKKNLISKIS
jgi:hypothetical protein